MVNGAFSDVDSSDATPAFRKESCRGAGCTGQYQASSFVHSDLPYEVGPLLQLNCGVAWRS